MYAYGMSNCIPCQTSGLGAIVMEPLKGGLGQGRAGDAVMRLGAAAPVAGMVGAGLVYGGVGGWAAQSWGAAGNSALMGAGLVGLASGLGMMGMAAAAPPEGAPPSPDPDVAAGVEGLRGLGAPGMVYTALGVGLFAWGAWRSTR